MFKYTYKIDRIGILISAFICVPVFVLLVVTTTIITVILMPVNFFMAIYTIFVTKKIGKSY